VIQLSFGFGGIEAELWRLLFVMTRIGAALLAAPLFGAVGVPMQVRVIATAALAVLVSAWHPVATPPALFTLAGALAVAAEVLVGLALGFVLQLAFAAPVIAAEVIGGAMGMSIATAADPNSGAQSPALGQYYSVTLVLVFLGLGGHLQFLRLVVESYTALPPGAAWLGAERIVLVPQFAGSVLLAAAAIALPVTLVLLVVQLVAAVLSRSAPSLNLFSLGLPAGVLAGIAALIASAPLLADQLETLSEEALLGAQAVLAG
jgi:flagellar biosynthetic protein FliR